MFIENFLGGVIILIFLSSIITKTLVIKMLSKKVFHPLSLFVQYRKLSTSPGVELTTCIRNANVQICGDLYAKYRESGIKRFNKAPRDGISVNAEFFDNRLIVGEGNGTVLMLPGAPGHFSHFTSLIGELNSLGVRVVAPNFPGECNTQFSLLHIFIELQLVGENVSHETKLFRHTPEERTEYIKAILQEADITSHIDMVVSHSSGSFISTYLKKDPRAPVIKSVALLNPVGAEPSRPMNPQLFFKIMMPLWHYDAGRYVLITLGENILRLLNHPFKDAPLLEGAVGLLSSIYVNWSDMQKAFDHLAQSDIPKLVMMSDNDGVMGRKLNANLIRTLGLDYEDDAMLFNDQCQMMVNRPRVRNNTTFIRLRRGGHFSFIKHANVINPQIVELLQKAMKMNVESVREQNDAISSRKPTFNNYSFYENASWTAIAN